MVSFLWLIAGFLCLLVGNGRWVIPVAAWLYSFCLLRFTHRQPLWRGFAAILVVFVIANSIAWQGTATSNPSSPLQGIPAGLGLLQALVFLGERWLAPRLKGGLSSLVFPLLYTGFEGLTTLLSPLGSIGMLGYTQFDNLPLVQLASLTGVIGITFLITWFGSLANWVCEQGFDWQKVRGWAMVYAAVLCGVLLYGGARLALVSPQAAGQEKTVRVAGITATDRKIMAALDQALETGPEPYAKMLAELESNAFAAARREARAGAQIILWNEVGFNVEGDESGLLERASALARQENVVLVVPLYITYPGASPLDVNKLVVIDPRGQVVIDHLKFGSAVLEDIQPGSGILQMAATPFGRISAVICRDLDFPTVMRQAGRNGTQILLAPSFDWFAIDPFHSRYAVFRAIENGVSLVRQVADGYSVAVDPYGRVVAASDYFSSQARVLVADVPVTHVATPYSYLGDWFSWAALVALVWVLVKAFR